MYHWFLPPRRHECFCKLFLFSLKTYYIRWLQLHMIVSDKYLLHEDNILRSFMSHVCRGLHQSVDAVVYVE